MSDTSFPELAAEVARLRRSCDVMREALMLCGGAAIEVDSAGFVVGATLPPGDGNAKTRRAAVSEFDQAKVRRLLEALSARGWVSRGELRECPACGIVHDLDDRPISMLANIARLDFADPHDHRDDCPLMALLPK